MMCMKSFYHFQLKWAACAIVMTVFVISCGTDTQKSGHTEGKRVEWTRVGMGVAG